MPSNPGVKIGRIYVGMWADDNNYYRIKIESADTVRFIDFGTTAHLGEDIDPNEICDLNDDYWASPHAYRTLPCGSPEESFLSEFLTNQEVLDLCFRRLKHDTVTGKHVWLVDIPTWNETHIANNYPHEQVKENRLCRIQAVDIQRKLIFLSFDDEDNIREMIKVNI